MEQQIQIAIARADLFLCALMGALMGAAAACAALAVSGLARRFIRGGH